MMSSHLPPDPFLNLGRAGSEDWIEQMGLDSRQWCNPAHINAGLLPDSAFPYSPGFPSEAGQQQSHSSSSPQNIQMDICTFPCAPFQPEAHAEHGRHKGVKASKEVPPAQERRRQGANSLAHQLLEAKQTLLQVRFPDKNVHMAMLQALAYIPCVAHRSVPEINALPVSHSILPSTPPS